jgi:hypothetical protein
MVLPAQPDQAVTDLRRSDGVPRLGDVTPTAPAQAPRVIGMPPRAPLRPGILDLSA